MYFKLYVNAKPSKALFIWRWASSVGGTNFFARSHGKILSWPLGCVSLSRNHWRANIRTCKPFILVSKLVSACAAGNFSSRGLFIRNSGLVRRQSVWPGSWDLGSFVPGSHRAGQLASSYERNKCFCMDNRRSAGSRPSGPSHLPGPYEQALTEANIYHWAKPKQRTKSGKENENFPWCLSSQSQRAKTSPDLVLGTKYFKMAVQCSACMVRNILM